MAGTTVSPAQQAEENVKEIEFLIGSDVRPAGWLARQRCMMERQEEMLTLEDLNTKLP